MKPRILIFADFYAPGFKAGGGLRTIVNMVERLSDEFEFKIVTRNHDGWGDFEPYKNVVTNEWNDLENAKVFYFPKRGLSLGRIKNLWLESKPDAIYLNSFFSSLTVKTLALRRFNSAPKTPVIIAPEGEFSSGALTIKPKKKKAFLTVAQNAKLTKDVFWKAAAEPEKLDIENQFGANKHIFIAPNMPPKIILPYYSLESKPKKNAGSAKILFLSRISRKKNLLFALKMLSQITGNIDFDIIGEHDDENYQIECERFVAQMPANIKVKLKGAVEYEKVAKTMSEYHFFILPTLGENFGHVVIEAFAAGCPAIISDQTPWRGLSKKKIGWDISLDDAGKWLEVLHKCVEMKEIECAEMAENARNYALGWLSNPEIESANRQILRVATSTPKS